MIKNIAFCSLVLITAGCLHLSTANYENDRRNAIRSTERFHELFNKQDFEQIYLLTDERARATKSKSGLIAMLTDIREIRGHVLKTELIDANLEEKSLYREETLTFRTKFENDEALENFVWYVSARGAGLYSYASQ